MIDPIEFREVAARARRPEAEVWIRLRPPTFLEAIGRELQEARPGPPLSDELRDALEWMIDCHAKATWDWNSEQLREAGEQLVEMVAPVLDDPVELRRAVRAWAGEWSYT
ncbi:MAG: hypothetical protein H0U07_09675 [Actinobacteria bacterium]|nr:hypothetical protein [Actinomycetota bacterium]